MSRLPLEQMMASLRPVVVSSSKFGTIAGAVCAVMVGASGSDAAVWLGQAGDVGHLLGRLLREQGEQVLGRDTADDRHPAQGRRLPLGLEVRAQEPDRLPVRPGQADADLRGQLLGEVVVPFVIDGEEPLVVDVDLAITDGGGRHGYPSSGCLPAMDMCAGNGIGRPGSRTCQYIQRNASLPQWLTALSLSRLNGPIPGTGYRPGSGSVS